MLENSSARVGPLALRWLLLGWLSAWPGALTAQTPGPENSGLEIRIDTPLPDTVIGDPSGMAFVAGNAIVRAGGGSDAFDIMFVVDRSQSTIAPAGGDVDGDGRSDSQSCRGVNLVLGLFGGDPAHCRISPDSILGAELRAVRTLVAQLDPRTTRVGVIMFSGDTDPSTPDAEVLCSLTDDYRRAQRALDDIAAMGPEGMTNVRDAVRLAADELTGHGSAPRRAAQRVIVFLSDGQPTAPFEQSMAENRRSAIQAAGDAARFGLRIDSYAIGRAALADPSVLVEMAKASGGIFTPVSRPSELQSVFERVSFSELDAVRLRNRTNRTEAQYVMQNADGSFAALLELAPGRNLLEVYVHTRDGAEQTRLLPVDFAKDALALPLEPRLVAQRNRLLERRLADLRQRTLAVQVQRDSELRGQLQSEMEAERARSMAERLRRLQIRAPYPGEAPPPGEER